MILGMHDNKWFRFESVAGVTARTARFFDTIVEYIDGNANFIKAGNDTIKLKAWVGGLDEKLSNPAGMPYFIHERNETLPGLSTVDRLAIKYDAAGNLRTYESKNVTS